MSKSKEPEFITPEEIERDTGGALSVRWQAKGRMRPGFIPYVRAGKKIVYSRADYRAYMAARRRSHTRDIAPKSEVAQSAEIPEAAIIKPQTDLRRRRRHAHRSA